jgi:membrane protein required for colicin V production
MPTYDLALLAVIVATTVYGFWKGMAWQLASLGSFALSYMAALKFSDQLAPLLSKEAPWNRFLAMLVIYLATSMVIWLVFRVVSNFIARVQLKEFDRQVGGLFGLAKGVLLATVITFFAVTLSADAREMVLKSRSGYYIAVFIHRATPVMPKEVRTLLEPYIDRLDKGLDPRAPLAPPTSGFIKPGRPAGT